MDNLIQVIGTLIQQSSPDISTDVKNRWTKGLGVRGGIIGTYKSEKYKKMKQSLNSSAGGNVDLILTGALSNSLSLSKLSEGVYKIISTDKKYEWMAKRYGDDQFGITEEERITLFDNLTNRAILMIMEETFSSTPV